MIHLSSSLNYYKRPDIQQAMVEHATGKEVAARFNDRFGKRPDSLHYPNDIMELAKNGVTSFHASEELWKNPLLLRPLMSRRELDELRSGWDLVLDVDCKFLEYSMIAADLIVRAIQRHEVSSVSAKFSGNHGFHIAVPFEAMPGEITGTETRLLFPEAAKRAAMYIKEMIAPTLANEILSLEGGKFNNVAAKTGVGVEKISVVKENRPMLDVEPFLAIDTILLSSRHMYRMPYSLHEKSGLASIPVPLDKIRSFDIATAKPDGVKVTGNAFLDRAHTDQTGMHSFFTKAFDATFTQPVAESEKKEYEMPAEAIPEQFFPPCMKKILNEGVADGKKRALFALMNFLSSCGWSNDALDARLKEWNKKNPQPLHETYLLGQLRYHRGQKKKILPPNCDNQNYYQALRVKCPEDICRRFKNPVGYSRRAVQQSPKKKEPPTPRPSAPKPLV